MKRAFMLIELLGVVAIFAILFAMCEPVICKNRLRQEKVVPRAEKFQVGDTVYIDLGYSSVTGKINIIYLSDKREERMDILMIGANGLPKSVNRVHHSLLKKVQTTKADKLKLEQ